MCKEIGVDPLSSNKGFWVDVLGVGDFYYELAVSERPTLFNLSMTLIIDSNREHLHCLAQEERWFP